jgi:hypothetical protein
MTAKALVSPGVLLLAAIGCTAGDPAPAPKPSASSVTGIQAPAATASTPVPVTATAAPVAAAGGPAPIATSDGETSGLRVEVTELKRGSGGTVNLKFAMVNGTAEPVHLSYDYGDGSYGAADFNAVGGVHLIDQVGKKKYFVARDTDHKCVCSQGVKGIPPGGRANLWAKFPAPPDDVNQITVVVPKFQPMDDVPLSR